MICYNKSMAKHGHLVSAMKAKEIIRHGKVRGRTLTKKQKGLFGLVAGGGSPRRLARKLKSKKSK